MVSHNLKIMTEPEKKKLYSEKKIESKTLYSEKKTKQKKLTWKAEKEKHKGEREQEKQKVHFLTVHALAINSANANG